MAKKKLLVCHDCGHEHQIKVYSREEAERERKSLAPARCEKCGSTNVTLHD